METVDIFKAYSGTRCFECGGKKGRYRPFCPACDKQLPPAERKALWVVKWDGTFQQAFQAALSWFRTHPKGWQRELFQEVK